MSMLDSLFSKGFKGPRCKTLLKLTIPRIKLLRNRRAIQIKQMRRDIAKLLESGQEATARIRVEHIIREEKMMAAQEIVELFCELIAVRLPIIETQRECPLDLKEAISSVCFAAPRCADLTELMQVQMLFATKYGKEFVSAATELLPECGVNRQLVELLSVRAPAPDVKLKLLKEIAEEHQLDWDPNASETELLKPHEDLLNGPTRFDSGSKLPLPKEKHDETLYSASEQTPNEQSDSDAELEPLDFPPVPTSSVRQTRDTASAPEITLPFPVSPLPEANHDSTKNYGNGENLLHEPPLEQEELLQETSVATEIKSPNSSVHPTEDKQFVPFISPPSLSSKSFSKKQSDPPSFPSRTKSEANIDLQDVLVAAHAAAETAERAAAAARSAASLAQVRISELVKKRNEEISDCSTENPFHADASQSTATKMAHLDHQKSFGYSSSMSDPPSSLQDHEKNPVPQPSDVPSYDYTATKLAHLDHQNSSGYSSSMSDPPSSLQDHDKTPVPQPSDVPSYDDPEYSHFQRLTSLDDETDFSYPNLFRSQDSNLGSGDRPSTN